MECNKDEAFRAKELAEKKMQNNDFEAAQRIALKAQSLYPELDNITQLLSICDVHCSAGKGLLGSEKDWYGILQVDKFADESTIKKQYRRLALLLHPDKNRLPGAEGAFKLICEANALLSDPTKKSLYDSKVKVLSRSTAANQPTHYMNRSSQPNQQTGAQNNISNGFSNLNQFQATKSTYSVRRDVFWTCCPFCEVKYQYLREFINRSLRCQSCSKAFVGYEVSVRGVSLGSKSGQPSGQHVSPRPDLSRGAAFQEKVVPNQARMGVQIDKGPKAPNGGSQGIARGKALPPEPSVQKGSGSEDIPVANAANVSGNVNTKRTDIQNAKSSHGGNEGKTFNGDARKTGEATNKSRKRGRKQVVESSDSFDTSSDSDEDLTTKGKFGKCVSDLKSESSSDHFVRRSTRRRQNVSYKETDESNLASSLKRPQATKTDNGEQKVAVDSEDSKHGNQSKESLQEKKAGYNKEESKVKVETGNKSSAGIDSVEIESDSDQDLSDSQNSDTENCPDPEFSDFDKVREESNFRVNQLWACYDTSDGMPRFYAKVKKVNVSPFELSITWLEADPIGDAYEKWVDEELPVGCGSFRHGKTENTSARLSFSHRVHCEKGKKRGSFIIYPRQGEVWALFKNWHISWSLNPENHTEFKYEVVEVLSNFVPGIGIKVCYLDKISGFVSLFQKARENETNPFWVGPNELYKFSHCVPSFRMTGNEREGVPIGSFELDPASLPLNPEDLFYPGKSDKRKGKSVASEITSTPKKFVNLEGTEAEVIRIRRSPRGVNVIR